MRHHIDIPDTLPPLVGNFRTTAFPDDARIGAKQIDRPILGLDRLDQSRDLTLSRDIGGEGNATNILRSSGGALTIDISAYDKLCAFIGKSVRKCAADTTRRPGYYD